MEEVELYKDFKKIMVKEEKNLPEIEFSGRHDQLEKEWELERIFNLQAGTLVVAGIFLARKKGWWSLFPLVSSIFLLEKGLRGESVIYHIYRKLGFRTKTEIEKEKYDLQQQRENAKKDEWIKSLTVEGSQSIFEICI